MRTAGKVADVLVARALLAAPDHRLVLDLLADSVPLPRVHRRVVAVLAEVGDRARPVRWSGRGWMEMVGGPTGCELVAEVTGWAPLVAMLTRSGFEAAPVEVLVERWRSEAVREALVDGLCKAEHSLSVFADPERVAAELASLAGSLVERRAGGNAAG